MARRWSIRGGCWTFSEGTLVATSESENSGEGCCRTARRLSRALFCRYHIGRHAANLQVVNTYEGTHVSLISDEVFVPIIPKLTSSPSPGYSRSDPRKGHHRTFRIRLGNNSLYQRTKKKKDQCRGTTYYSILSKSQGLRCIYKAGAHAFCNYCPMASRICRMAFRNKATLNSIIPCC